MSSECEHDEARFNVLPEVWPGRLRLAEPLKGVPGVGLGFQGHWLLPGHGAGICDGARHSVISRSSWVGSE